MSSPGSTLPMMLSIVSFENNSPRSGSFVLVIKGFGLVKIAQASNEWTKRAYFMKSTAYSGMVRVNVVDFL